MATPLQKTFGGQTPPGTGSAGELLNFSRQNSEDRKNMGWKDGGGGAVKERKLVRYEKRKAKKWRNEGQGARGWNGEEG